MAIYVPTNWKTGDVITATKLNNMETGIAGALQTSGGTMTGNITMSGDAEFVGNASTASTLLPNAIRENSDMNDFTTPGVYVATSTSVVNSITNAPNTDSAFILLVLSLSTITSGPTSTPFQIFISVSLNKIYTRYIQEGKETDWALISSTNVT